jgi:MFS family permease
VTDDNRAGSLREVLTPDLKKIFTGVFLNALGGGLTMTLLLVYLNDIRGIGPDQSSFLLSWGAVIGLACTGPIGALVDRVGPRPVMLVGLLVEAVGVASWCLVHTWAQGFIVTTIISLGGSAIWGPQSALLARVSPSEHRQRVFGIQFMLLNAGLGTGGLVAALIVQEGVESSFIRLYVINAASYLFYFFIILSLKHIRGREVHHDEENQGSYRDVIRDKRIVRLALGGLLLTICGYSSIEAGEAIFATTTLELPPNALGIIFGVNTFTIFSLQGVILKKMHGHSRTRMFGFVGILWAMSWVVVALSVPTRGATAVILLSLSQFIFAIGEMLLSPIAPSLANDLAPAHLRGRYNALLSLQWGVANSIGPMFVAFLFGRGYVYQWLFGLVTGALVAGYVLTRLRSQLTPEQDGRVATS